MSRVVITGIGVVSPIGNDKNTFWDNIKCGKHGINRIDTFDTEDFPIKVAAQVKNFDPMLALDKKEVRRTDLYCQYAIEAARQAIDDCGTTFQETSPYKIGVIVGSGIGGIRFLESEHEKFLKKGTKTVSPFTIPMIISNIAAGSIAIKYGFKGKNFSISTACASSSHTIGEAFSSIKSGMLDVCITGGAEAAVTKFTMAGFNNMKAMSVSDNPDRASIPFDRERNGFVLGEGASILVLESLEHAQLRNAHIYAEVVGYGATDDAYHITSPDLSGEVASYTMKMACENAGISECEIDYINAHGTSTQLNDKCETEAIKMAFGEKAKDIMVSSTKSMTGHLLGAAGAIETTICALALQDGFIPMTVGYKVADIQCDLNYVTECGIKKDIQYVLSNSFGFGGHNATLCLKKWEHIA